jgi:hypothetical protein
MTTTAPQTRIDPLHAFMAGKSAAATPMPLVATRFDVIFDAGLAIVTTSRTFRNNESSSIEATLTFPVPVHATLFGLQARIGERVLVARAKRKEAARADYEAAIDRGKTAVLHEEVLRGVHMLSVGQVPPGSEVAVEFRWAMVATNIDGRCHLRIPLTVGDIYGPSGLLESDDLIHAGSDQTASLAVQCRDGTVTLRGGRLDNGCANVPLDAPIDLEVAGWKPRELRGRAADGHAVALRIEPAAGGDSALDLALLVDRSGSMSEACTSTLALSKHATVLLALDTVAKRLHPDDALDLWEFSDSCHHVGSIDSESPGGAAPSRLFSAPHGGTSIGPALETVIARSDAPDILLLTDGKSHALNVQSLARSGRRVAVVLIGEDSLEANVGHLAALTGGEIFIAAGHDIAAAFAAALRALRSPCEPTIEGAEYLSARRSGMRLIARFDAVEPPAEGDITARGVAALAASLWLPTLTTGNAARLAEAEGLVTHLTSLVLVDENGATQESVPASRKIPLATPATQAPAAPAASLACLNDSFAMGRGGVGLRVGAAPPPGAKYCMDEYRAASRESQELRRAEEKELARVRMTATRRRQPVETRGQGSSLRRLAGKLTGMFGHDMLERSGEDLSRIANNINWDFAPDRLQAGDLKGLGSSVQEAIRKAAAKSEVIALARTLGVDPIVLVIGLMAHAVAQHNRSARRLARALLSDTLSEEQRTVARGLGLG